MRAATHRRRRAPMSLQRQAECLAAINRALACNFPEGYVAQIDWSVDVQRRAASARGRSSSLANGSGWGTGAIEHLVKPGAKLTGPVWMQRAPVWVDDGATPPELARTAR